MSNLKLRVSWGNIGNQNVDPYQFVPAMEAFRPNWVVDGSKPTALEPPALVSNSFTWEKVSTLDFGFDLGLFNNRLNMVLIGIVVIPKECLHLAWNCQEF